MKEADEDDDENNQTENASYIIITSAKGLQQGTRVGKWNVCCLIVLPPMKYSSVWADEGDDDDDADDDADMCY